MRKRNFVIGTIVIASALFSTGCSGKFSPANFGDKMFLKIDTNGDGFVNKKEHLQISINRFIRADDNEDNQVTKIEIKDTRFSKIFPSFGDKYFIKNDLNNNNIITKAEVISNAKNEFIKSDKNKDNKLSRDEMKEYKVNSRFESIDKNKDGLISKDEYKKQQQSPFGK